MTTVNPNKDIEQLELLHTTVGNTELYSHFGKLTASYRDTYINLPYNLEIIILHVHYTERDPYIYLYMNVWGSSDFKSKTW